MTSIKKTGYLALVYAFLYLPIVMVVVHSFNATRFSLLWHGFTLKWYIALFHDPDIILATVHSLSVALLAATIATALGLLASTSLFRYRFRGQKTLNLFIFLLVIVPDIITAISLLLLYNFIALPLGFFSLLIAHITLCTPFAVVLLYGRITTLNPHLFETAKDLGASEFILLRKIIFPLMKPALLASWLLCFTLSLDDVIISFFVSGPSFSILPLHIYSLVRVGVSPEINALCSLILLATILLVFTSQYLLRKKQ